ncbi:hypothetical protein E3V33_05010 [Candidatus Marinimicrobia bacterium MT.SAG.4]|nr:hypothetical protein E3V33_05010 [Candidatus Marinimicrobia bacterium MT.SAG.4]
MNKQNINIILFAILFPFAILSAQRTIPNNIAFATETIKNAINELKISEELRSDKTYHIQRSKSDSLSAFLSDVVSEYLKESGHKTVFNGHGDNPESDLLLRIIEPILDLDVKGGKRTVAGKFTILLYSVEAGEINWGKEYSVIVATEDNVDGMSMQYLNSSAPGFLRIEKKAVFSGKKLEKVLALTVAGIITYLFYSIRG